MATGVLLCLIALDYSALVFSHGARRDTENDFKCSHINVLACPVTVVLRHTQSQLLMNSHLAGIKETQLVCMASDSAWLLWQNKKTTIHQSCANLGEPVLDPTLWKHVPPYSVLQLYLNWSSGRHWRNHQPSFMTQTDVSQSALSPQAITQACGHCYPTVSFAWVLTLTAGISSMCRGPKGVIFAIWEDVYASWIWILKTEYEHGQRNTGKQTWSLGTLAWITWNTNEVSSMEYYPFDVWTRESILSLAEPYLAIPY